ncbi:MAG: hypothetical protein J7495_00725 [Sphingomonas sp.]|nr:hypothetical protein [Sphingomonas sp.]
MASTPPPRTPMAGGLILAVAILAGAFIGAAENQATIGLILGTAAGAALALAVWLVDRMRRG